MDLLKVIKRGDRVVIKTPQGQERKGKAVMYNRQYNSWVLNMGGAHGTPGIASEKNIVSVNGKPLPKEEVMEPVQEFGEKLIGYKYNVYYKDDVEEKGLKKMQVRGKTMRDAANKALGWGASKFIYRVELAEGEIRVMESDLPSNVRITPLATQRRWEDLTDKALKKWSWAKDKIAKMMYNHDLFFGVEKDTDNTYDLIWNYPLAGPVGISYAIKINARDFDAILKDPVRWLIERFGVEKAHGYLQRVKSKSFWDSPTIQKIFSKVKKEVAESHGVVFTNEATYSYDKIKKDPKGWYQNPGMMGHHWAKERLQAIEQIVNKYGSSDWQRYIISNCFNFDIKGNDTWHAILNIDKKYLAHVQYVLRNGGKLSALQLLWYRTQKSGYWKDPLDHALEYAAYKHDPEKYTEWYSKAMGFYGLPKDEAAHRLRKYIETKIAPKIVNKNLA